MSAAPLRIALVGTGGIAQAYGAALQDFGPAHLVGVADLRLDAAQAFADTFPDCLAFASHADLLVAEPLDGVIVCTPPATHPDVCVDFLKRRVPVLCEKPLAIDPNSASKMFEVARANETLLTMASKFRYVEDVVRLRSMITSGTLGEISLFENAFTGHVDMSKRWNSDPALSGGGVLIDNGTHSVDVLRYLLGPITSVQAIECKRLQPIEVEDTVRIFARTRSGVVANVDLSWSIHKELESFIDVYGSRGTARVGWARSTFRRSGDREWSVFGDGYDKAAAFRAQLANFTNAVLGVEPPLVSETDAMASVHAVSAAYRSMRANNWIQVERGG